jgi:hypothetical protein
LVQKSFLHFEAEEGEGVESAVVEVVDFGDVYCYYSGHQIFDASPAVNVAKVCGECDAVVIVAVADVVEVPEVGSKAGKNVGVVLADEGKTDEPLVEGEVQVVEHSVEDNQLMADKGYMLAELAEAVVG